MRVLHTESISKITEALSKVQGIIEGASKDSSNPFHKSKYADLESVWEVCRQPLSQQGLAVFQSVDFDGERSFLITTLSHVSGEWMKSYMPLIVTKNDSQGQGAAITYARRYALAAMIGIYQTDDDGEKSRRDDLENAKKIEEEKSSKIHRKEDASFEPSVFEKRQENYDPSKRVSPKQVSYILSLLNRLGDPEYFKTILNTYGISKIDDLQMSHSQVVIKNIQTKLEEKERTA